MLSLDSPLCGPHSLCGLHSPCLPGAPPPVWPRWWWWRARWTRCRCTRRASTTWCLCPTVRAPLASAALALPWYTCLVHASAMHPLIRPRLEPCLPVHGAPASSAPACLVEKASHLSASRLLLTRLWPVCDAWQIACAGAPAQLNSRFDLPNPDQDTKYSYLYNCK
jgi:hypothetical protein